VSHVRQARLVSAVLVALAAWSAPRHAAAYERQFHLGGDAGLATLSGQTTGYLVGGHLTYGLNDWLDVVVEVQASHHPSSDTPLGGVVGGTGPTLFSGVLGLRYALDITQWVPYAEAVGGGYHLTGPLAATAVGGGLAFGLDYQIKRSLAAGFQVRADEIFAPDPWGSLTATSALLRAEYLWGF
jgi:hypothetical protein